MLIINNTIFVKSLRVGIYLRLSDEDQNKIGNSESIKNQRNLLLEEIKSKDNYLLIDEYCDENLSGAGTYRPEFERLIKDCENGKLDIVLCKSQSRFSRDMEVIEKYIHNKFIEWNVRFIGLADNADSINLGNKKARQINGLVNEWYLEDVSNNIRSAFKAKMIQGEFISPFAAYGYKISLQNNNKLIVDQTPALVVKRIFSLYLKGFGFGGIAKALNEDNIPSPSYYKYLNGCKLNIVSYNSRENIKWSANAIKRILSNELYIGNLIQGKRTTISYKNHKIRKKKQEEWIKKENTHQPIIDKDIFCKVQKEMSRRTRSSNKKYGVHIFSGKVFCLECGQIMRKKVSTKYEYLVCGSTYNHCNFCKNYKAIRYDILKSIVLKEVNQLIKNYFVKDMLCEENIYDIKHIIKEKKNLKKQVLDFNNKLNRNGNYLTSLYEDKINKKISPEQFDYLFNEYTNSNKELGKQIDKINTEIENYNSMKKKYESIIRKFKDAPNFKKIKKSIVDEFIKKIYIGPVNKENNCRDIKILWDIEL